MKKFYGKISFRTNYAETVYLLSENEETAKKDMAEITDAFIEEKNNAMCKALFDSTESYLRACTENLYDTDFYIEPYEPSKQGKISDNLFCEKEYYI